MGQFRVILVWWVRQELNLRSSLCKSDVITPRPRTPGGPKSNAFKSPMVVNVNRGDSNHIDV